MNANHDRELAAQIDRELKSLTPLTAPSTLAPRVMALIAARAAVPWYRRAWQTWPPALRTVSMLVLLAAFAGVCLGSWQLIHVPAVVSAAREVGGWLGSLGAIWKAAGALVNAVALAFKSLGAWVLVGCVAALLFGYATCVGLGTIYLRLAFARR